MSNVGFIGIGAMGEPMAANLLKKGFSVTVLKHRREEPATLCWGAYALRVTRLSTRGVPFGFNFPSGKPPSASTIRGACGQGLTCTEN